jgi:hypothetical protein
MALSLAAHPSPNSAVPPRCFLTLREGNCPLCLVIDIQAISNLDS